jgi:hypothetical protein
MVDTIAVLNMQIERADVNNWGENKFSGFFSAKDEDIEMKICTCGWLCRE